MSRKTHQAIWGVEERSPEYSVRLWIERNQLLYFRLIPLLCLALITIFPSQACLFLFFILNILYLVAQLFKLLLIILGAFYQESNYLLKVPDILPIYTILLPVYREEKVIKRLVKAISDLDYPKNLLDVKLLIEEDDLGSLAASSDLPDYFEIIKIPVSFPRTKPKACNYGLQFARGEYIVVYDAEDQPHPQQLKQVLAKFDNCPSNVICVQARLNYYNRGDNYLTKIFSIEYSLLFDYMLVGLKKFGLAIPLGGASNHFIREKLNELGGWDAFNVTEDADLGIRLYAKGYACELIANITLEEAPITIAAWVVQRARWIKGHMLTSFLYLNRLGKINAKQAWGLFIYLYIPNLTYILLPVYLLLRCLVIENDRFLFLFYSNISLGISLPIIYSLMLSLKLGWRDMKISIFLSVFYYLLFPLAAIRACWQILTARPFYWDKTEHGVCQHDYD